AGGRRPPASRSIRQSRSTSTASPRRSRSGARGHRPADCRRGVAQRSLLICCAPMTRDEEELRSPNRGLYPALERCGVERGEAPDEDEDEDEEPVDEAETGIRRVIATHVFFREEGAWKLVQRHASPVPADDEEAVRWPPRTGGPAN